MDIIKQKTVETYQTKNFYNFQARHVDQEHGGEQVHLGARPHQRPGEEQPRNDARRPRLRRLWPASLDEARETVDLVLPPLPEAARVFAVQHAGRRIDRDLSPLRPRRSLGPHEEVVRDPRGVPDGVRVSVSGYDIKMNFNRRMFLVSN